MYQGSCHCGQTRFTLNAPALGPVAECNCSHCQRKGYLLSFHDRALLHIQAGEGELASYSFHKHVIAHKFCPRCGCAPFGLGRAPDGTELARGLANYSGAESRLIARRPSSEFEAVLGFQIVLCPTTSEEPGGVSDHHLLTPLGRLLLAEYQDASGEACAIEKVGRQADDRLDQIHLQ